MVDVQVYRTIFPELHRHKVFVSYHHANDQSDRDRFERLFAGVHRVLVSKSVQLGDIGRNLKTDAVKQRIRERYLRDSTVTVVLIGADTWRRKHVDWEIGSSVRHTEFSPRSGLLGIILPSYPRPDIGSYNPYTIPPRLYDNVKCGYAEIHNWSENPLDIQVWIDEAFERRSLVVPDNSFPFFVNNRKGDMWQR